METTILILLAVAFVVGFFIGAFVFFYCDSATPHLLEMEDPYQSFDEIDYDNEKQVKWIEKTTDRNMKVVENFMEHFKNETEMEIPESVFLSFFNA